MSYMTDCLQGRLVVVSPHLDDAVLSLGAAIAAAITRGASVTVLSVFCGDPFSQAPAGSWDRKSGFTSEGEASRARREEDRQACAILGAVPHWLPFGDDQYERHGGEEDVGSAVVAATTGADRVLIPGWPLVNPDHAWLSTLLLRRHRELGPIGLYAEQPYAFQNAKGTSERPSAVEAMDPQAAEWECLPIAKRDRQLKRKAVECYASQVRQLGLGYIGLRRLLADERKRGGESVCWVSPESDALNELDIAGDPSKSLRTPVHPSTQPTA